MEELITFHSHKASPILKPSISLNALSFPDKPKVLLKEEDHKNHIANCVPQTGQGF